MGDIIVHGMIGSPFVRSVLVALAEKVQSYRLIPHRFEALSAPDYEALHPFRRVPVFEQDGFFLYETQAILRHIDRGWPEPPLSPRELRPAALMDQWLNTIEAYLFTDAGGVLGYERIIAPRFLKRASDEEACARAAQRVGRALGVLARGLGGDAYLTGATLTLADIALACHLDFLRGTPEGEQALAAEPRLDDFLARMAERPGMAETTIPALARRFLPKKV